MDQSDISGARAARARLRAARRLGWLIPAALGAVVLGLQQSGEWNPPDWLIWVALLSGFVSILIEGLIDIFRDPGKSNALLDTGDRLKFMSVCAVEIHQLSGFPMGALGLSVWVVHRPRVSLGACASAWVRLRRPPPHEPYLYRIERFRPTEPPPTSQVWPPGRGVIGECLANNREAYRDYRPLQRDFPLDQELSATRWKSIEKDHRDDGFARGDFLRMIHRYEQVFAYPLTDKDGRLVGCISLDVTAPEGDSSSSGQRSINTKQVVGRVHQLAESMRSTAQALAVRP